MQIPAKAIRGRKLKIKRGWLPAHKLQPGRTKFQLWLIIVNVKCKLELDKYDIVFQNKVVHLD